MKNLATCKPSEFIAQTAKIRKSVANWIDVIDIVNIRATRPQYKAIPIGASAEEQKMIIEENALLEKQQAVENANKILDNMLAVHQQETLEVMALCCFVEPSEVDNHPMDEYLQCIMEMVSNKSVMDFFKFLAQLRMQK